MNITKSILKNKIKQEYELNIIGKLDNLDNKVYQDIVKNCKNVLFHGLKRRDMLLKILSEMDVGIGAFFSEDNYLKTSSSLKVREYLAAGLGVYTGHYDEQIPSDFPYLKVGKPNIEDIVLL